MNTDSGNAGSGNTDSANGGSATAGAATRPLLRIVRGTPDDLELAALAAVVASLNGPRGEEQAPRRSAWGDPVTKLRTRRHPGPGAWRASGMPH